MGIEEKKKSGNVVFLAGNGSLANSTATTRPLTNSTVCLLKISCPLRQLYFETSRPLSHHANRLPHVRVPHTAYGSVSVSVHSVCTIAGCQVV